MSRDVAAPPPTPQSSLDRGVSELRAHAEEWARAPIRRKIELLEGLRNRTASAAEAWVEAAAAAKHLPPRSPFRGEEWASGPWTVLNYLGPLRQTLEHLSDGTTMRLLTGAVRQRPDGQTVVRVVPRNPYDHVLLPGHTVEIWMEPDVTPTQLPSTIGAFYRQNDARGGIGLATTAVTARMKHSGAPRESSRAGRSDRQGS